MRIRNENIRKFYGTKRYYAGFYLMFFCFSIVRCFANGSDSLKKYYVQINKAELAICDSNYMHASKFYRKAFNYAYPFSSDLNNAFIISYTLKDSFRAKLYAEELSKRGIPVNKLWIKFDSAANPSFFQFVTQNVDSIMINSNFVNGTYESFKSLVIRDQEVREFKTPSDSMVKIDSLNLLAIEKYIIKNGYPKSGNIMYGYTSETVNHWCHLLLWHQRGLLEAKQLDSLLLTALNNGRLSSHEWEVLTMFRTSHQKKYASRLWVLDISSLSKKSVAEINKNREQRYLESLSDYKKKYDYEKKIENKYGCSAYGKISLLPIELVPSDNTINAGLK